MPDFTSALYLGLRHESWRLRPWSAITTGVPAALEAPPDETELAGRLAALQGCESALLGPSTLHLFWDLFVLLEDRAAIYMDAGVYPIARWGIERVALRGWPIRTFRHHDPESLQALLRRDAVRRLRPLVVTDGLCPGCGGPAPLAVYLASVRRLGGWLIVDDTQALGIISHHRGPDAPYGRGGGGSLRWNRVEGPEIILVSSLAKGLGAPVAVLSGPAPFVRRFMSRSATRMHSSPPSVAALRAAEHALAVNASHGDALRLRLASLVRRFRARLADAGFSSTGGLFPVQTLLPFVGLDVGTLHECLFRSGVRTVLHRGRHDAGAKLTFIITARHRPEQIDRGVDILNRCARREGRESARAAG